MRWLRLWTDSLDSKKIQRLTPTLFRAWINLLLATARNGSIDGDIPLIEDLCFDLRESTNTVTVWLESLVASGLIDCHENGFRVHDWKHWQPIDRTNTDRQSRFRKKNSNGDSNEGSNTQNNAHRRQKQKQKGEGRREKKEAEAEPPPLETEPPEYPDSNGMFHIMPGDHPINEIDAREIWGDIWRAWKTSTLCFKFYEHQQWVSKIGWEHAIKVSIERGIKPKSIKYLETIGLDADINGIKTDKPIQRGNISSVPYKSEAKVYPIYRDSK